jgi:DNA-binding MarR family transcriptional regulator
VNCEAALIYTTVAYISLLIWYQQADIGLVSHVSQQVLKSRSKVEKDQEAPQAAIGRLLKNIHQSTRQAVEESLRRQRIDLSFAHFVALYTLASEPGIAGAEVARRLFVTAQTMNTILRRLEKDGAIERRPNPSNQRADSWSITKSGQARMAKARVVAEGVWSGMFDSLKTSEVLQLQQLLERCLAGLEKQVTELRAAKSSKAIAKNKSR